MSKIPGLGPRSARRGVLSLIKNPEKLMLPLANALIEVSSNIKLCSICGNIDSDSICGICKDEKRDKATICVVEDISDLWALERSATYSGYYHVLGGVLSPLDGIGPDDLMLDSLLARAEVENVAEVILATSATVDGKTTAHYITERLVNCDVNVTALAHGIPVGGELDYLDDGTLSAAIKARREI